MSSRTEGPCSPDLQNRVVLPWRDRVVLTWVGEGICLSWWASRRPALAAPCHADL